MWLNLCSPFKATARNKWLASRQLRLLTCTCGPWYPSICAVPALNCSSQERAGTKGKGEQVNPGVSCNFSPPRPDFLLPITLRPQVCFLEHPSWLGLGSYLSQGQTQAWHFCGTGRETQLGPGGSHRTLSTWTEEFGFVGLALWESHRIMQEGVRDSIQFLSAPTVFPHPAIPDGSSSVAWHACSVISCSATLWTVAYQAPLSMEFSRQQYCSGLPFPPPGDLPDPGIKPRSPALQANALLSELPGKPHAQEGTGKYLLN